MSLFHTYQTISQAQKLWKKAQNYSIKPPKDRQKIKSITDNDRLFTYALVYDKGVSREAIAAITDPLAIHRLVELWTGWPWIPKACALNPCHDKGDLLPILSQVDDDARKDIISSLTKQDDLVYIAVLGRGIDMQKTALRRINDPAAIEEIIYSASFEMAEEAVKYLSTQCKDANDRLVRLLGANLEKRRFAHAAMIRTRLKNRLNEADEMIISSLLKEMDSENEISNTAVNLLDSVTTKSCLYRFACTARFEKLSLRLGPQTRITSSDARKKYEGIDAGKVSMIEHAVSKLDEKTCYQLAKDPNASSYAVQHAADCITNEDYLADLVLHNGLIDKSRAVQSIRDPQKLMKIATSVETNHSCYRHIINRLSATPEGQSNLGELLQVSVKKNELNTTCTSAINNEDVLYRIIMQYPNYRYRETLCERYLAIADNERQIVNVLRQQTVASEKAVQAIGNADILKEAALHARSTLARSQAAKRLLDLGMDGGCVHVLHNVCPMCGGHVKTTKLYPGTIEAHYYYECEGCGRSAHETILGNDEPVVGEYYKYAE